jgi:glycosyltransferase involved in cell wall biosynthesis
MSTLVREGIHVAIDARMARSGGIGTYIRALVPRLVRARPRWDFTILTLAEDARAEQWWGGETGTVHVRQLRSPVYSVAEQWELRAARPRRVDLFWSPHYNVPLLERGRLLVTVHDVIHLARPEYRKRPVRFAYARGMFAAVRRRAAGILFDSAFTSAEFHRLVGAPAGAHEVVHLGVDDSWRDDTPSRARPRPYLLHVGYVKPHKNVPALIRAFALLADHVPHDLVIVGRRDGLRTADDAVAREAAALGARVVFTGETSPAELHAWVRGASVLVQPSLYEGFGLPPLEAMAAGCPCVVARAGSLPEVCGDAVLYCDPLSPVDMATSIRHALCDESIRASLRHRGLVHAARFTWERCAEQTISAMERVLG